MPAHWSNEEIELLAERAYQLYLQGKNEDARIIFEGLIAIDPRNVYCLEALASLHLLLGSVQLAVDYADRALAFSPRRVNALACRCEGNLRLGRLQPAQQDLEVLAQLRAEAQVARLAIQLANAKKFAVNLLPGATSPGAAR